ncbi:ArsR family transcriptional regulator [Halonotius aquaticus]|uniref:ArsR family transcriptional regulator n=1 Tax=Halonotius aquaticus TaxID=2216978 RepID=A0A3A6PQ07_9EURY|nr:winged helix-turn-helix domain-containing protein [Halonotius aquaticus]RJX43738.1 ArsR family transcriptional regulator [Halonotius aquaticus]
MSDETDINDDSNDDTESESIGDDITEPAADNEGPRAELRKTKERLEAEADRAVSEFDEGIVDLLAWLLDTETRARIYVYLRQHPHSTSDEIAEGTGLYPSTVREALADLHDEDALKRRKRDSDGAGNNPYEYKAIAPSSLVRGVVGEVQEELNTVFTLESGDAEATTDDGPVTITIDSPDDAESDAATDDDDADDADTDSSDDAEREDV